MADLQECLPALGEAPALTIGINARAAAEVPAGTGRVVRELLRALAAREDDGHRYVLYARKTWDAEQLDERFTWQLLGARDPWWHLLAARAADRVCDVFLCSNSYVTAWFLRIPAVTIVYDMVAFEPALHPNRRGVAVQRLTLRGAVRRSARLLAISQATAAALAARYPFAADRTVVAPLGVSGALSADRVSAARGQLPPPGFVLAVGTLEPRKNLPRLIAAYLSLDEELQRRHPLVVAGAPGWQMRETLGALESLRERCTVLGFVSDEALAELYRSCAVFCYPSLGEGFGLPVLEAMAAGAAVVTSEVPSLLEVGGDAVAYVDPQDVGSIAAGLRRALLDEGYRADLGRRGLERSREFSWQRFSELTLAALDEARRG